jgi:hypothetical protein
MKHLSVLVAAAVALAGCYGPIKSTKDIIDAEVDIQAARTAGAEKLAPYEWTTANLYLHKAREEVAYSNYQAGVDFAKKASSSAKDAVEKAMARKNAESSSGDTRPTP